MYLIMFQCMLCVRIFYIHNVSTGVLFKNRIFSDLISSFLNELLIKNGRLHYSVLKAVKILIYLLILIHVFGK